MRKWLFMAGLATLGALAATCGALAFQLVWHATEPPERDRRPAEVEVVEIVEQPSGTDTALEQPPPKPDEEPPAPSAGPPPIVVFLSSDGPHPAVDEQLLGRMDWSPCSGQAGRVAVVAMSLDQTLINPMVLSDPMGQQELESCARQVIEGTSTSGAPADYLMLSARVELK